MRPRLAVRSVTCEWTGRTRRGVSVNLSRPLQMPPPSQLTNEPMLPNQKRISTPVILGAPRCSYKAARARAHRGPLARRTTLKRKASPGPTTPHGKKAQKDITNFFLIHYPCRQLLKNMAEGARIGEAGCHRLAPVRKGITVTRRLRHSPQAPIRSSAFFLLGETFAVFSLEAARPPLPRVEGPWIPIRYLTMKQSTQTSPLRSATHHKQPSSHLASALHCVPSPAF